MEGLPERLSAVRVDTESLWHDCEDLFLDSEQFQALPPNIQLDADWIIDRFGFGVWQRTFSSPADLTADATKWCLLEFLPAELADIANPQDVPTVVLASAGSPLPRPDNPEGATAHQRPVCPA